MPYVNTRIFGPMAEPEPRLLPGFRITVRITGKVRLAKPVGAALAAQST